MKTNGSSTGTRRMARGLSLVELMVAVAILGVLVAAAVPSLSDLLERRRVVAVAQELAGILNYARSETNVNGDMVNVHLEKDPDGRLSCAMVNIHNGTQHLCKCYRAPGNMCGGWPVQILRVFQIENSNGVSFEASATNWGLLNKPILNFERGKYFPEVSGVKIDVTGKRTGAQLRVEINEVNRVRVCSPDSSVSGYPSCG